MKLIDWLQLLFLYLKLTGQIEWSWICVMIPFICYLIALLIKEVNDRRE